MSLAEWASAGKQLGNNMSARDASLHAKALASVDQAQVQQHVQAVVPAVGRLLEALRADRWKATAADALGTALCAHPDLRRAVGRLARISTMVEVLLEDAATDSMTYSDSVAVAQLATAQSKLQRHSATYWRTLEQKGLNMCEGREVRTSCMPSLAGKQWLAAESICRAVQSSAGV